MHYFMKIHPTRQSFSLWQLSILASSREWKVFAFKYIFVSMISRTSISTAFTSGKSGWEFHFPWHGVIGMKIWRNVPLTMKQFFCISSLQETSMKELWINFFIRAYLLHLSHVCHCSDTSSRYASRMKSALPAAHVSINIIWWIIQVLKKINKVLSLCFEFQYFPCHGLSMPSTWSGDGRVMLKWWLGCCLSLLLSYQFANDANLFRFFPDFLHSEKSRKSLF